MRAGDGGDGSVHFFRAKFIPRGGPDGGDGGRGGGVVLAGSSHLTTLRDFQYQRHFTAGHGEKGGGNQRSGAAGPDLVLRVPLGTVALEDDGKTPIGEVTSEGELLRIAEGGSGGLGNVHFKSSVERAPRRFTPGEKREGRWVRLELRLIADIGIVGPPNAGKSTLLAALTAARPKIGAYPFTTVAPNLGVLESAGSRLTLADVPGLLEGAHEGTGLGDEFLRHIARTRGLLYLVPLDLGTPAAVYGAYRTTRREIALYDRKIERRPSVVALSKADLPGPKEVAKYAAFFKKKGTPAIPVSAARKSGLEPLVDALFRLV